MNKPFEQAWKLLKALPEDSLYTETIDSDPAFTNQGGYQVAPSLLRIQERLKTMHPAIVGMLNRRKPFGEGIGKIIPEPTDDRGYGLDPEKFPYEMYQDSQINRNRIRDVPTATKQGYPTDEEGFPAPYTSQDDYRSPMYGNEAFRFMQQVDTPTSRHVQYDPYRTYDGKENTGHQSPEVAMGQERKNFFRAPPDQLLPRDQSMGQRVPYTPNS
jgi:hypothetical protein